MSKAITIIDGHQHNLKNVHLSIPKNKVVVFTGVSGSGKSSLVFDTIYAEAQRQLIETFSSYARRRLPKISRPHVEEIRDLSPVIVIDQKRMGTTLRSTVGTATEIYTYLRMLFSRCGDPFVGYSNVFSFNNPEGMCPACNGLGKEMAIDENSLLDWEKSIAEGAVKHSDFKKGGWYWRGLMKCGFFDPHKPVKEFSPEERHGLLYRSATKFTNVHQGEEYQANYEGIVTKLKRRYINREEGATAYTNFFTYRECSECHGTRINHRARSVRINEQTIGDLVFLEMPQLLEFLNTLTGPIAQPLAYKMKQTVQYLVDIGVGYLSLHRPVATLSGGESQRVKMARQLDCNLVNLIYVLDEPSIGLHPRDISHLIEILKKLRDKDNSLLVVEHDPLIISSADHIVDIGPGAGTNGGEIIFEGTYEKLQVSKTTTARYLNHPSPPNHSRRTPESFIQLSNVSVHNLKNVSVKIPTGIFLCITGVAGSGKSSLIMDSFCKQHPGAIVMDQSPVGRSNRSNPMTYVGIFDMIRKEFADATGKDPGLFSFNSKGACPKCKGIGYIKVEMSFLDDVTMTCDTCQGERYTPEVLELEYRKKNISQVLGLTVNEAIDFFKNHQIIRKLKVIQSVGLGYLELGQSLNTLSGGEAQRIKLASELHKRGNIYVMDEPTTGLHMADIEKLLQIIHQLVESRNSVIVIEHNLDIIKNGDWVIDMGPEGGSKGGEIIAEGTPEEICKNVHSYTGTYLKKVL